MEEMHREGRVGRTLSLSTPPSLNHVFTNTEALQSKSCWVFTEASLHGHN